MNKLGGIHLNRYWVDTDTGYLYVDSGTKNIRYCSPGTPYGWQDGGSRFYPGIYVRMPDVYILLKVGSLD